ncbi:MAG: BamA/TamA family outer membrane protein [Bdellovibrio sp.]|nr:BamA/TamA family outer membrane protein [Bdellovibrio sp.]
MKYLLSILIFCCLISDFAWSSLDNIIKISNVKIDCEGNHELCKQFQENFKINPDKMFTETGLYNFLGISFQEGFIKNAKFQIIKEQDIYRIRIILQTKIKLKNIEYKILHNSKPVEFTPQGFSHIEYFEDLNLDDLSQSILDDLESRGMIADEVEVDTDNLFNDGNIKIFVNVRDILYVNAMEYIAPGSYLPFLREKFQRFVGKQWNKVDFEIALDNFSRDLFYEGYFFSEVKYTADVTDKKYLKIKLNLMLGVRYNIAPNGNKIFSRNEILSFIHNFIRNRSGLFDAEQIKNELLLKYQERGLYGTSIVIRTQNGKDRLGQQLQVYYFDIHEGHKVEVVNYEFAGITFFSKERILSWLKKLNSSLVDRGYLDETAHYKFSQVIKNEYLKNGFFDIEIHGPFFEFAQANTAGIVYKLHEGKQYYVRSIKIQGLDAKNQQEILAQMHNTVGGVTNFLELDADVRRVVSSLNINGYIFAFLKNQNDPDLLRIDVNNSFVDFNFDFELGKKVFYEDYKIIGNNKTKPEVISREIDLAHKQLITPALLKDLTDKLLALGLFSAVTITPIITTDLGEDAASATLLISVQEKDSIQVKIAPGFRTDLGLKTSATLNFDNLFGSNKSLGINAQANRRFDLSGLDSRRRSESKNFIEWATSVDYAHPYLFNTKFKFDASSAASRKRFYGFDAEIFENSVQLSRDIYSFLSIGAMYQLEVINQYDASKEIDSGYFRIGSLSPSITFDFRDNALIPHKGFLTSFTYEVANPALNSLDREDIEINYYKLIWRNKVYLPINDSVTFATSLVMGMEENLAKEIRHDASGNVILNANGIPQTKGYIPSIKVFRLDGFDTVRGYSDTEINRLQRGPDINEMIIQDRAYFLNLKLEPRIYIDDSMMLGVFLDAGRVYVQEMEPEELRFGAGTSLKLVTPVGTLDFNYGIKLKRGRDVNNNKESFGRFHISIGYF